MFLELKKCRKHKETKKNEDIYLLSEATYSCCTLKMIKIRRNVKNGIDDDLIFLVFLFVLVAASK